jgi:hypothetical protein
MNKKLEILKMPWKPIIARFLLIGFIFWCLLWAALQIIALIIDLL